MTIVLFVVVVVVAWKVFASKLTGKIGEWKQCAADRGYELDLTHRAPPSLQFDLFTAVTDAKVWTTVTRPESNDSAYLYKFEVRSGDDKQKFRRTCALIELPCAAPKTTLRPRSLQMAPPRLTDGDDHLLGIAAFDEIFRLQGADESFAQALFRSDLGAWLLTPEGRAGDVEFEFRDDRLLCAGPKAESIDELIDFLEWAQGLGRRAQATLDLHTPNWTGT